MINIIDNFNTNSLIPDYGNVEREINVCRTSAALFDFSFMTFITIKGIKSIEAIATFSSRSVANMNNGQIKYSLYCSKDGYIISDITIWRVKKNKFIVMSGRPQDYNDFKKLTKHLKKSDLNIKNEEFSALSIQGPHCLQSLAHLIQPETIINLKYFQFSTINLFKERCYVGRLGYTGERGFELILPQRLHKLVWNKLIKKINPAGFYAIDCLRIEAGFLLFCNEFSINVTPSDAGMQQYSDLTNTEKHMTLIYFCIKLQTEQYFTKDIIKKYFSKQKLLNITSLCYSKRANGFLGLGYLKTDSCLSNNIQKLEEDNYYKFKIIPRPFYNPLKTKPLGPWSDLLLPLYL